MKDMIKTRGNLLGQMFFNARLPNQAFKGEPKREDLSDQIDELILGKGDALQMLDVSLESKDKGHEHPLLAMIALSREEQPGSKLVPGLKYAPGLTIDVRLFPIDVFVDGVSFESGEGSSEVDQAWNKRLIELQTRLMEREDYLNEAAELYEDRENEFHEQFPSKGLHYDAISILRMCSSMIVLFVTVIADDHSVQQNTYLMSGSPDAIDSFHIEAEVMTEYTDEKSRATFFLDLIDAHSNATRDL
ncbi:MAG: hypothetical protein EOP06_06050 [Proteobacteria bacterium]|nr:MAG: hypothetical protein EOP06_06050 [Pseudomonadota bacterium]